MADTAQQQSAEGTMRGIAWMVLTTFMFVAVTGIVRYLGSDMPAIEAAFIRYCIGLAMITPMALRYWSGMPSKGVLKMYGWRALVHGGGVMLWFYAMARIPIAEVTAIGYLSPIFVTIGAAMFLGEKLHMRRIGGILVGIVGALVILRPGFAEINIGQFAQLVAAPLFAVSWILAKKLTAVQNSSMIVWMLSLGCTVVLLPGALLQWRSPTMEEVGLLALTAFFATMGHYTLTRAFKAAPITVTQPIGFLQLVWAALLGMMVFDEALDPFVFIGGAIVVAAASYISHREMVASRAKVTPPAVAVKL